MAYRRSARAANCSGDGSAWRSHGTGQKRNGTAWGHYDTCRKGEGTSWSYGDTNRKGGGTQSDGTGLQNGDDNDWWNNDAADWDGNGWNGTGNDWPSAGSWESCDDHTCPLHGAYDIFRFAYNPAASSMSKMKFDLDSICRGTQGLESRAYDLGQPHIGEAVSSLGQVIWDGHRDGVEGIKALGLFVPQNPRPA